MQGARVILAIVLLGVLVLVVVGAIYVRNTGDRVEIGVDKQELKAATDKAVEKSKEAVRNTGEALENAGENLQRVKPDRDATVDRDLPDPAPATK